MIAIIGCAAELQFRTPTLFSNLIGVSPSNQWPTLNQSKAELKCVASRVAFPSINQVTTRPQNHTKPSETGLNQTI